MRRGARAVLEQADGRATDATETSRGDSGWERTPSTIVIGLTRLADERLARAVANGDERAFATIYERYHQELYRYCYWIVRNCDDAYDALQSTLLRSLSALQRRQRDAPLRPWLFRIAHNESISVIRRRDTANAPLPVSDRSAPSAEESASDRAHLALLVSDLHELPERQRSALLLRELSGLSHREIAVALKISMHTVKHAIADGRRSLAEQQAGRTMRCQSVRQSIAYHDKRVLKSLRVRAHLRDCPSCAELAATNGAREADLRLLVPPLAPLVAAGLFAQVHHAAGAPPATSTGVGLFAGASGKSLGAALATKTLAAAAIVVTTAASATASAKLLTGGAEARQSAHVAPGALHAAAAAHWAWPDPHPGSRHHHGSTRAVPDVAMALTAAPVPLAAPAPPAATGSGAIAELQVGQADAQQASATPDAMLGATVNDQPAPPNDVPLMPPNTSTVEEANTATPPAGTGQTGEAPPGEGHGENGHSGEGHTGGGHGGEPHGGNGQSAEGHSSEGHGGEGHSGEGHAGEPHASAGQVGEGHPRGMPMNPGTAHSHAPGPESVPGSEADGHGRSQEGAEHARDRGPWAGAAAHGEPGPQHAGSISSGPPESHVREKLATPASQGLDEQPVGPDPEGHPAGADPTARPAGPDLEGHPAVPEPEGHRACACPQGNPAGGEPSGAPSESARQRADGTGAHATPASASAAPGGPAVAHGARLSAPAG
ncbi:MAG TPA: sigma-70 family RNA polymerase sigma factor [Solirubrobacteraceae bacterium]|jgi:RNA polymerase sigma factor (sigma-70 family)